MADEVTGVEYIWLVSAFEEGDTDDASCMHHCFATYQAARASIEADFAREQADDEYFADATLEWIDEFPCVEWCDEEDCPHPDDAQPWSVKVRGVMWYRLERLPVERKETARLL